MKTILLVGIVILTVAARADTIVFDSLGPTNTYDPNVGNSVQNPFYYSSIGGGFIAQSSGFISTVELGLTFIQNLNPATVDIFLYGDVAGRPDNDSQTFLGAATPTAAFGLTNSSVVSFIAPPNVSIVDGEAYWLVIRIVTPNAATVWNIAGPPSVLGPVAFSTNNTNWQVERLGTPAFRLRATAVPEPGGAMLLTYGAGLLTLAFATRNVISYRRPWHLTRRCSERLAAPRSSLW